MSDNFFFELADFIGRIWYTFAAHAYLMVTFDRAGGSDDYRVPWIRVNQAVASVVGSVPAVAP